VDFEVGRERTVTLKDDLRKGARIEGPRFPPALWSLDRYRGMMGSCLSYSNENDVLDCGHFVGMLVAILIGLL
jgi:hypothetical protein